MPDKAGSAATTYPKALIPQLGDSRSVGAGLVGSSVPAKRGLGEINIDQEEIDLDQDEEESIEYDQKCYMTNYAIHSVSYSTKTGKFQSKNEADEFSSTFPLPPGEQKKFKWS